MIVARITAIFVIALMLSAQTSAELDLDKDFSQGVLIISANENACHVFDIYIALSRAQQMQGLMFVREMPATRGMLFVYREAGIRSMWMKNTYIPLDILFIRADGTVSSIAKHTEPHSLKSISAIEPVNFVLELNAGLTDELGIEQGSMVYFSSTE
jgi:uncharacterized membrane protein (UPF0127 family)